MRISKLTYLTIVAISLLACTKEPLFEDRPTTLIPLNISSSISQVHTKATAEGFVDKDAVGLYAVNYSQDNTVAGELLNEGNQADNVKYIFNESEYKWTPVKNVYYKDVNTNVDLYLYYPYMPVSDVKSCNFEVKQDQSSKATAVELSGYEASDFLWGKQTGVVPTESKVAISLSHRLSAVHVILKENGGFSSGEFANLEKSVILSSTTRKAKLDFRTGEALPIGEAQLNGIVMCSQEDNSFRAIAVPQTVVSGAKLFAITINGQTYEYIRNEQTSFVSGKVSEFTINIKKKVPSGEYEFTMADAQITNWTEDKNSHGDEARQYFVVSVEAPGTLGETITAMGKNPDKIKNLKVLGPLSENDFYFMRDQMSALTSINLSEASPLGKEIASLYQGKYSSKYNDYVERYGIPDSDDGFYARWYDKSDGIIPQDAFKNKSGLVHFIFPKNITEIETGAFHGTNLSGALILPERLIEIGSAAFYGTLISSISFPEGLISIDGFAFAYCNALTGTLTLPSSLQVIRSEAFQDCNFTGRLILPENLEILENSAFERAGSFDGDLIIPEKVNEIGERVFYGSNFTGPLILNNVTKIGEYAFSHCGFRGELIIPEGTLAVNVEAFSWSNFSSVAFPGTLIRIEPQAFYNTRLTNIEFQEGLISIGQGAFRYCNDLLELDLPSTLQTIQSTAFENCFFIHRIICSAIEPPTVFEGAFNGVAKDNFTVEVPAQSVKRYQAEPGWSDFTRIAAHYDFSVSRERMRALNAEQTRTYTLRAPANFNWSIKSKPDWVTVSPESGTGKTDITVTVSEMARTSGTFEVNEGTYNSPSYKNYKGRSGEIIFQLDEQGVDYTCTFEVEQYDSDYSDGEKTIYQTHSKGNGIDIVFVGDGYDAKDIAKGTFDGNVKEGIDAFFGIEPYKTYKDYFNVYAVVSQSDDSGIGTVNTVVDTKFGTYFTQNRIKVPASEPIFTWAKKADAGVDFTKALVINLLNTSAYEGICAMYADGSAIAFCPVSRDAYPYDFRGLIQHEAGGHGFGKLGDEYIYHNAFIQTCVCPDGCEHPQSDNDMSTSYGIFKSLGWYKNLSMNGDMHQVPWAHLIYNPQYSNYVDIYEGGYMHSRGMYRSEATSCMNNNIPYYSAISRQAIVERIMSIAGEEFTLEKFYANDKDDFGTIPTRAYGLPSDRTYGVDPMWNRGSEEGSVVYLGEHPDYSKIK